MIGKYIQTITLGLITSASLCHAQHSFEWVLDGGIAWFDQSNTTISPTDIETDTLSQKQTNPTGDLGLSLYFKQTLLNNTPWFNTFGVGLGVRYSGFSNEIVSGKVFQFEQYNLNNYQYKLSFENTRLLAQLTLDVFTYKQASLFLIGGLGEGWSQLRYHDAPYNEELGGGLSLPRNSTAQLVGEAGVGINYLYTPHIAYSIGYLYTDYGSIAANNFGHLNGEPVTIGAPSFSINSHAFLVGIHYLA